MECFKILGISPTKDLKEIKKAYARMLTIHSPETDPEGFQALRTAYEQAVREVNNTESQHKLLSPTEEFMKEFEENYRDFGKRISTSSWTELLERDICFNLSTSEEISHKILSFLMDNYNFPHPIWELFNSYFSWKTKRNKLCESFPENFVDFVIYKINEKGTLRYEPLQEGVKSKEDEFIDEYEKGCRALDNNDLYIVKKAIDTAKVICPKHPDIMLLEARYMLNNGRIDQGLSIINNILSNDANDSAALFYRGELFFGCGKLNEAYTDYNHADEIKPNSAAIMYSLGKCCLSLEKYEEAVSYFKKLSYILTYNQDVQKLLQSSYFFQIDSITSALEQNPFDSSLKFKLAEAYYETGDTENSYKLLAELKQDTEFTAEMYSMITQTLMVLKKDSMAYSMISEGLEHFPKDAGLILYKASLLDDIGKLEESLELYDKAAELNKDNATIYNNKAFVLNKLSRYNEALECCNKSLSLDSNSAHAYKNKAAALLGLNLYEDCLNACEEAINIYAYLSDAYILKIKALIEIEQYDYAINTCDKAINLGLQSNELYYQKAYILYLSNRFEEAIRYCNTSLEADENNGNLYECKGLCLYDLQEYEAAVKCLSKATELNPSLERSHYYKILSLINTSKSSQAMGELDKLIKTPLERADRFHDLRGDLLEKAEKYEEAFKEYEKAIKLYPDSPYYHYSAGSVLTDLSRYQDSLTYLDKAIELDTSMVRAYITKSYALYNLGYYEKCIEECNKAIELDSEYPIAYQNKAWALYKLEKTDEAEKVCSNGLKLDGNNLNLLSLKMHILGLNGMLKDALVVSDRILELYPEDTETQNARKELLGRINEPAKNKPKRKLKDILFGQNNSRS